jgi:hypothetical protein
VFIAARWQKSSRSLNLHGYMCGLDSTDDSVLVCLRGMYRDMYTYQFMNKLKFTDYL